MDTSVRRVLLHGTSSPYTRTVERIMAGSQKKFTAASQRLKGVGYFVENNII